MLLSHAYWPYPESYTKRKAQEALLGEGGWGNTIRSTYKVQRYCKKGTALHSPVKKPMRSRKRIERCWWGSWARRISSPISPIFFFFFKSFSPLISYHWFPTASCYLLWVRSRSKVILPSSWLLSPTRITTVTETITNITLCVLLHLGDSTRSLNGTWLYLINLFI